MEGEQVEFCPSFVLANNLEVLKKHSSAGCGVGAAAGMEERSVSTCAAARRPFEQVYNQECQGSLAWALDLKFGGP